MNTLDEEVVGRSLGVAMGLVAILFAAYSGVVGADEIKVALNGDQEIPPVTTPAAGSAALTIGADKSISGVVTVTGMSVTVAHIHEAAAGANGRIVIPLVKTSANTWAVPAGTMLTDAQYESYKAGNLYINVHSEAHKSGEIRGQVRP